jgi:uncharacterized membrane protein
MKKVWFPEIYKHEHEPVKNVNEVIDSTSTFGERVVDKVVSLVGSWKFIIIQSLILTFWVILNVMAFISHWDPYPFILMNLALSLQAAYTAPIIMMSQNRQSQRDRIDAHLDYQTNQKAEEEVRIIIEHLEAQNIALTEILKSLNGNHNGEEIQR